jgi:hypothetical protein
MQTPYTDANHVRFKPSNLKSFTFQLIQILDEKQQLFFIYALNNQITLVSLTHKHSLYLAVCICMYIVLLSKIILFECNKMIKRKK